ncbi:MAG: hypothetical protein ACOC8A_00935 [bacterium]
MSILKKHFVWILLGIILLAEGAGAFMLFRKKSQVKTKRNDLQTKRQRLAQLQSQTQNYQNVIQALEQRNDTADRESGRALLFLWHRSSGYLDRLFGEQDFKDQEYAADVESVLASYRPVPWKKFSAQDMGDLKDFYQRVYDASFARPDPSGFVLGEALQELRTTRLDAGFAGPDAFSGTAQLLLGDIFAEQKEYWIRKEIVRLAAQAGMYHLDSIQVDRTGAILQKGRPAQERIPAHGAQPEGELFEPIGVRFTLQGQYNAYCQFAERLVASPLGFRIRSTEKIVRHKPTPQAAGGEGPGATRAEAEPVTGRDSQLVEVVVLAEVPDFNVDLATLTFPRAQFPNGVGQVKTWLGSQVQSLATRIQSLEGEVQRLETRVQAARKELEDVLATAQIGQDDGAVAQARQALAQARQALAEPTAQLAQLRARQALWQMALEVLDGKRHAQDVQTQGDIVLTLRPRKVKETDETGAEVEKNYFDPAKMFKQQVNREKDIQAEFGLVTYEPRETGGGIKRAGSAG